VDYVDPSARPTYANILLWGPEKTGKTTSLSTLPGQTLLLNAEQDNSTRYAHKLDSDRRLHEPVIPPYVKGEKPIKAILREVMVGSAKAPTWDNVVVDTSAELYRRMLEEHAQRAANPSFEQRSAVTGEIEQFYRFMVAAPVNFLIVAHEMQTDDDGKIARLPLITSKSSSQSGLGPKVRGMVDMVAYSRAIIEEGEDEPTYVAQISPGDGRHVGVRFPELLTPEGYRKLDFAEWFEIASIKNNGVTEALESVAA
jgi:AAA domain-containing protein